MKTTFGLLLALALVIAGADGLAAQQPTGMRADSTQHARQHTTRMTHRHRRKATTHHARRHTTAARERARTSSTRMATAHTRSTAIGREIGSSGISSTGTLQRLPNGLITPDAARSIALRRISGGTSVSKIELQSEDGRQVYDVKVTTPNQKGNEKVRVDARSGAVLEVKNVDNPIGTATHAVTGTVDKVTGHH